MELRFSDPHICVKLNERSWGFFQALLQETGQTFCLHICFLGVVDFYHLSPNSAETEGSHKYVAVRM